jgi:hypothetical protein
MSVPASARVGGLTAGSGVVSYCGAVRHARGQALDELEPFLERLRGVPGLVEKKRGVFYVRSQAFLHFHEDPSGLHADVRLGPEFSRFRVETEEERDELLARIQEVRAQARR